MRFTGTITIVLISCLFAVSCKAGRISSLPAMKDTGIIAESRLSTRISNNQSFAVVPVYRTEGVRYAAQRKYMLYLVDPSLERMPDGVYEVYVTSSKPVIKDLRSSSKSFADVLDLYMITPGKAAGLNITRSVQNLAARKGIPARFWVTIIFRGNQLPGNKVSKETGLLNCRNIVIEAK